MNPLAFLLGILVGAVVAATVVVVRRRAEDRALAGRLLADAGARQSRLVPPPAASHDPALAADALHAVLTADDVTRSQDDLLRRRLAGALAAIPAGVLVTDTAGEVVFRNAAADEFHGARHGEALVEAALGELLAAAVGGQPGTRTLELFGPPRRILVVSALPLGDGEPVGALALVDDVTDRRRLEEVRRDFVANMSHELKTPVGALSLLAETLLEEDDPGLIDRLIRRMVTEAGRVSDTIDDLLLLSRIESEVLPPHERLAVGELIGEAVDRLAPKLNDAAVRVAIEVPDEGVVVMGDQAQLVSALVNLLDNAVKYSEGDAEVTVRAQVVGDQVHLAVEDRGIGIPTRDVERIFERFYRVDAGRSRRTGGTGLGLSIVRHVAVNHDGDIRVDSRLGEGSTFTLCLPRPGAPAAEPDPAAREGGAL
jgi:two-component system, OmpR family, sensor histidine kinase SenX3